MNINRSRKKARDSIDTFKIEKNKNQDILEFSSKGNHTSSSDGTKYSWDLIKKEFSFKRYVGKTNPGVENHHTCLNYLKTK